MVFVGSDDQLTVPTAVKIVIAGGFGIGKTTMVASVSEIPPLRTEELLTEAGVDVDDLAGVEGKDTTTVALDFGRITINAEGGAVPVRHAGPEPVLVHVGRARHRRDRRRRAGRHPPARLVASRRSTSSSTAGSRSSSR